MRRPHRRERWAIILAGGEGQRMSNFALTRFGERRPKQYCNFMGEQSMFRHTMKRAIEVVGGRRLLTVIGRGHFQYIDQRAISGILVEQPQNRGTAPGVYLPLSYIMAYDPDATVLVFPSDHFISPNSAFVSLMKEAATVAEKLEDRVVLAAAVPDSPEVEYGWIQPGETIPERHDTFSVRHFHEKPDPKIAEQFFKAGFLWNTLNIAVKAKALWQIGWQLHPVMMDGFEALKSSIGTPEEASILGAIYESMSAIDFSKDVLERAVERSLVMPMTGIEWSDWGRPERIEQTIGRRMVASRNSARNDSASAAAL